MVGGEMQNSTEMVYCATIGTGWTLNSLVGCQNSVELSNKVRVAAMLQKVFDWHKNFGLYASFIFAVVLKK